MTLIVMAVTAIAAPVIAQDETLLCQSAKSHAAAIGKAAPIEVDSATNTTAARTECDEKTFVVERTIDLKHARMEDDFANFLTEQINEHACKDGPERDLEKAGWTVTYQNRFSDGPVVNINVACK